MTTFDNKMDTVAILYLPIKFESQTLQRAEKSQPLTEMNEPFIKLGTTKVEKEKHL